MHWTPKGYKPWRQRPEVPSEKPKHKNNSMSKNKIPSSEVPGARPLPAAGTSPFPRSWRSQARLTQSRSSRARNPPGPARLPAARAAWQPSAPPRGRGRDCGPGKGSGGQTRKPSHPPLAVPAGPPPPPCAAGLSAGPLGLPLPPGPPRRPPPVSIRAEVRRPPGSPTAARRKRPATAAPSDPAARGASGSGQVPCDVAARRGRLRAGGRRPGRAGGADPGRGAAPLLDGRGRPERRRRRRRSVSDRPPLGVFSPVLSPRASLPSAPRSAPASAVPGAPCFPPFRLVSLPGPPQRRVPPRPPGPAWPGPASGPPGAPRVWSGSPVETSHPRQGVRKLRQGRRRSRSQSQEAEQTTFQPHARVSRLNFSVS
ncbi:hypothetical protein VULLAG_LOCUS14140 [Vulpes lagopus]